MAKKGQDTTMIGFFMAVVVLIITLAILLPILLNSDIDSNIDNQACLASVQARSTFNLGKVAEVGKDFIPLNCKTETICIIKSGDKCDASGFTSTKNNEITKVKVGYFGSTKEKTIDTIANQLYDCHKMLGQGELNFLPSKTFSNNYCLICDHIVLDEKAREQTGKITFRELYQYMASKYDGNGKSYLEFVYGVKNPNEMLVTLANVESEKRKIGETVSVNDLGMDFSDPRGYVIMAQMSTAGSWVQILSTIGIAGGTIGVTGTGAVVGTLVMVGGPVSWAGAGIAIGVGLLLVETGVAGIDEDAGTKLGDGSQLLVSGPILVTKTTDGSSYARPTIYKYDAEVLKKLQCNTFELAP